MAAKTKTNETKNVFKSKNSAKTFYIPRSTHLSLHTISQYASSLRNRAHRYGGQDSPFLPQAVAKTIASTHCTDPRRDGQAEWAWVVWTNTGQVDWPKFTHPSSNRARRSLTLLTWPTPLPLCHDERRYSLVRKELNLKINERWLWAQLCRDNYDSDTHHDRRSVSVRF